jgi:hypothetical protein
LVERVHHWPGVNGLSALLNARRIRATRPLHFFRSDGPMPMRMLARAGEMVPRWYFRQVRTGCNGLRP